MKKLEELRDTGEDPSLDDLRDKLNEVIRVMNSLKCVEEEEPIYEVLNPNAVLIISKNEDGLLVACNSNLGDVRLERVKYPKEVKGYE